IAYEPGVEMTLQLTKSAELAERAITDEPKVQAIGNEAKLKEMVNAQPFQTIAEKPPEPSDVTNLMLIGSLEQLEGAFAKAGWMTAEALNANSGMETF